MEEASVGQPWSPLPYARRVWHRENVNKHQTPAPGSESRAHRNRAISPPRCLHLKFAFVLPYMRQASHHRGPWFSKPTSLRCLKIEESHLEIYLSALIPSIATLRVIPQPREYHSRSQTSRLRTLFAFSPSLSETFHSEIPLLPGVASILPPSPLRVTSDRIDSLDRKLRAWISAMEAAVHMEISPLWIENRDHEEVPAFSSLLPMTQNSRIRGEFRYTAAFVWQMRR